MKKVLKTIFIISLILLIISLSFKLFTFNINVYKKEFKNFNIYDKIPNADENAVNLINFINNKEGLNDFYNEKEKLHLEDVKTLYNNLNFMFYLSLILTILFLIYFIYSKDIKIIYSSFLISGIILIFIMFFFLIIDFNHIFEKFHTIVFNNNYWLLNPDKDNLINLFTLEVQYNIALKIFINILIFTLTLLVLSIVLRKVALNKRFLNNRIFKN